MKAKPFAPCPSCGAPVRTAKFDWEQGHWVEHQDHTAEDCWVTHDQFMFLGRWFTEAKRDEMRDQWPNSHELRSEHQLRARIEELTATVGRTA